MDENIAKILGVSVDEPIPSFTHHGAHEPLPCDFYDPENVTGNALQTESPRSPGFLSTLLDFVNDSKFHLKSLRNSPYPQAGDDQNKISSAYVDDLKTVGYGRKDTTQPTTYNNSFDPRLTFQGLGESVFTSKLEALDDESSKARMTENVFLALDNPSAIANDYLYGYREYLKNLTSLPTIHIGSGDESVSDDGSEECKRLFQRIRSESVKSMFPQENQTQEQPDMDILSEKSISKGEFPTELTYQNHNQSNQVNTAGNNLTTATVLKHNREMAESASKNIFKSICEGVLQEPQTKLSEQKSKLENVQQPKMQYPPGFHPPNMNKCSESIGDPEKLEEDSTTTSNKLEAQKTTSPPTTKDRPSPTVKKTTTEPLPISVPVSEKQEIETKKKPEDPPRKSHSGGYQSQVRTSASQNWRQREPLRDKKLKDLSELRHARCEEEKKPEHSLPNNASWAEKLFHKDGSVKEKDSKEKKSSHDNKPWTEKSPKTVTSNLKASSEPFIPPPYVSKSNNTIQVQTATLVPVEEFKPRSYSQNMTHAHSNNFAPGIQPAAFRQSMYVPTNVPPPPVHNWAQYNTQQNLNLRRVQENVQLGNWLNNDNTVTQPLNYDGYQYQQHYPDQTMLNPVEQIPPPVMPLNNPAYGQNYQFNQTGGTFTSFGNVLQASNGTTNVPPQYTFSQHQFLPATYQPSPPQQFYSYREFRNGVPFNYNNNSSKLSSFSSSSNNNNNNNSTDICNHCDGVGEGIPCVQFRRSRSCEDIYSDIPKGKFRPRAIRSNLVRIYPTEA